MKATAQAPANIAFIKYWGKSDEALRLPLNDSFSMNLSGAFTTTTVEFSDAYGHDEVQLLDGGFSERETARVIAGLDRMRLRAGAVSHARVVTQNTFPKGAGSAASASGFAALTVAASAALGLSLPEKDLTILARQGSGSACRSIPDGFVVWEKGSGNDTSYAYSLYPSGYWDIRDFLVITDSRMKKVSTSDGMAAVCSSPLLSARLAAIPGRIERIKRALREKDFALFGEVAEEDCLDMHRVMETQVPPLWYRNGMTEAVISAVGDWRSQGIAVYFTIDAGPNVHILCQGRDADAVRGKIAGLPGIERVIENTASGGTMLTKHHLF